ncbi:PIN domain-containing protein [Streptomyces atacamensis]|jgi:hypothetical protein|uniref:hypothetical protein n=1 Tax=Streptomyces atacamensis TaxID=531966 RepID=UPI00399C7428
MQPVVLDTDIASLSHKRKLTGPLAARLIGRRPLITFTVLDDAPVSGRGPLPAAKGTERR